MFMSTLELLVVGHEVTAPELPAPSGIGGCQSCHPTSPAESRHPTLLVVGHGTTAELLAVGHEVTAPELTSCGGTQICSVNPVGGHEVTVPELPAPELLVP